MNVISRGVRNAFRNGVRTLSVVLILGLSIGLALSMLLANRAVGEKIESVKSSTGTTLAISPAGVRGFEGGGDPITETQIEEMAALEHVVSVSGTLSDRLTTDNSSLESALELGELGRRYNPGNSTSNNANVRPAMTPAINIVGTQDAAQINSIGNINLVSGEQIDGSSSESVALIGQDLAEKNGLTVGDSFTAYDKSVVVKGIIDSSSNRFAGNSIIVPLALLQDLTDQAGAVTAAVVTVDSMDNLGTVETALKDKLGDAVDITNSQTANDTVTSSLKSIQTVSIFGLIASVVAGAVIIVLTMVMIVRERRREIGVMKAIGAADSRITVQFVVEAATFTMIAAVVGIGISILAANPITDALVNNSSQSQSAPVRMGAGGGGFGNFVNNGVANLRDVTASISWDVVLYGVGAALLLAIVGSVVATAFITKVKPAEAIRAE